MTVTQAAEKWGVAESTVWSYIGKGYIYGLSISEDADRNQVILPSIPAPRVKNKPKTVNAIDKYILKAMNEKQYVNAKIMGISQEAFEERLQALLKSGAIYSKEPGREDYSANLCFVKAPQNRNGFSVEVASTFAPKVELKPSVEIKVADQIGLANANIKVPFGNFGE